MRSFIILCITVVVFLFSTNVTAQDTVIDDTIVTGTIDQATAIDINLNSDFSFDCEACNQYDIVFRIDKQKYSYTYNELKRLIQNDQELRDFTIPVDPAKIPSCVNMLYSLGWRGGVIVKEDGTCDIVVNPLK
jgi:hypothetical protein